MFVLNIALDCVELRLINKISILFKLRSVNMLHTVNTNIDFIVSALFVYT